MGYLAVTLAVTEKAIYGNVNKEALLEVAHQLRSYGRWKPSNGGKVYPVRHVMVRPHRLRHPQTDALRWELHLELEV